MRNSTCDAKVPDEKFETQCDKLAYRRITLRQNYWFGEKYLNIDICQDHFNEVLKALGFKNEYEAQRDYGNSWRKTD